jgi:hypothetical protein
MSCNLTPNSSVDGLPVNSLTDIVNYIGQSSEMEDGSTIISVNDNEVIVYWDFEEGKNPRTELVKAYYVIKIPSLFNDLHSILSAHFIPGRGDFNELIRMAQNLEKNQVIEYDKKVLLSPILFPEVESPLINIGIANQIEINEESSEKYSFFIDPNDKENFLNKYKELVFKFLKKHCRECIIVKA